MLNSQLTCPNCKTIFKVDLDLFDNRCPLCGISATYSLNNDLSRGKDIIVNKRDENSHNLKNIIGDL